MFVKKFLAFKRLPEMSHVAETEEPSIISKTIRWVLQKSPWGSSSNPEDHQCVFCKISHGQDPATVLHFQDEAFVAISDIHPASTHHILVIPKEHIRDARCLTDIHISMVNRMMDIGKDVVRKMGCSAKPRMGFHWPPFTSISHLHLHVIAPEEDMSFVSRIVFKPDSLWFMAADSLLARLEKMKPPPTAPTTPQTPDTELR